MSDNKETRPWEPYIPTYVDMYYVDYRDDLSGQTDLLQRCVDENSLYPISEKLDDWWDNPEAPYIEEMEQQMANDGLEFDDDWLDEIRDALWAKDTSTPIDDLLRNTGALTFFYSLGVEIDGWHSAFMCNPWRGDSEEMAAYKIRRALGISKNSPEAQKIWQIVVNAPYGGELRIYFEADLRDMLSRKYEEHNKDFKSIHFKGTVVVALYDHNQGSGYYEEIEIDRKFPFKRENLALSESEKYSIEECFGMCGDWLRGFDAPTLSFDAPKNNRKLKSSTAVQDRAREAELDRIFKAGDCTFGDMNYKRHRDVYYRNEIPCGSHCPHCGTFWID